MDSVAAERVELAELLDLFGDDHRMDLHTGMPARVESYTVGANQIPVVKVTPQLNRAVPDGSGDFISEQLPQLDDVPVIFPRCGNWSFTFPLAAGDMGWLAFSERSIATWRQNGTQGDPGDIGMHLLDGAVFYPGLFPDLTPSKVADANNMVIGHETVANARIVLKPSGEIDLGANSTDFVALASKVDAIVNILVALMTAIGPPTPLLTTAPGSSDIVSAAVSGAISTLEGLGKWPPTSVAAVGTKAT